MPLYNKVGRTKVEYKMYQDISDKIKLHDGKVVYIHNLNLDTKTLNVLNKINERKSILKEVAGLEDRLYGNFEREKELEDKLRASDAFFCSINEEERKRIEKVFETQGENLARTPEWQSYHMIFSTMDQLAIMNKAETYYDKLLDLEGKADNFKDAKNEAKKVVRNVKEHNFYKSWDKKIDENKKKREKHVEKYQKLTQLGNMGDKKMEGYVQEYYAANDKWLDEQRIHGSQWVGQYGLKVQELKKDIDVLSNKLSRIDGLKSATLRALDANKDYLTHLQGQKEKTTVHRTMMEYKKAHEEAFKDKQNNKIPPSVEEKSWIESCQNSARKFMEKQNLHQGRHKNSKEFDGMMKAMDDIINYSNASSKKGFGELLEDLKQAAKHYGEEKRKQHRPFPSFRRTARIKMADAFESWAEMMSLGMQMGKQDLKKEQQLTSFFENEGKVAYTPVRYGNYQPDPRVISKIQDMVDLMNENFTGTMHMDDSVGNVCENFKHVCTPEKIAYSLGFASKTGDEVKNMKLSDVMTALNKVYAHETKKDLNEKTVEQELQEMDLTEL